MTQANSILSCNVARASPQRHKLIVINWWTLCTMQKNFAYFPFVLFYTCLKKSSWFECILHYIYIYICMTRYVPTTYLYSEKFPWNFDKKWQLQAYSWELFSLCSYIHSSHQLNNCSKLRMIVLTKFFLYNCELLVYHLNNEYDSGSSSRQKARSK